MTAYPLPSDLLGAAPLPAHGVERPAHGRPQRSDRIAVVDGEDRRGGAERRHRGPRLLARQRARPLLPAQLRLARQAAAGRRSVRGGPVPAGCRLPAAELGGSLPLIGPELARAAHWQRELPRVIAALHEQTVGVHAYPLTVCATPRTATIKGLLSTQRRGSAAPPGVGCRRRARGGRSRHRLRGELRLLRRQARCLGLTRRRRVGGALRARCPQDRASRRCASTSAAAPTTRS